MKTEDLKLGNYLIENGELIKVVEISRKSLRVYNDNKHFRNIKFTKISDIEPIELTINVLEDCDWKEEDEAELEADKETENQMDQAKIDKNA